MYSTKTKSKWKWMGLCVFAGWMTITGLLFVSKSNLPGKGSFNRIVPPHSLLYQTDIQLPGKNYYFAGSTAAGFFMAVKSKPNELICIERGLKNIRTLFLVYPGKTALFSPELAVTPDSTVFVSDGTLPGVWTTRLPDSILTFNKASIPYFRKAVPTGGGNVLLQQFDTVTKKIIFNSYLLTTGKILAGGYAPEAMGDPVFSVDGSMAIDPETGKMVYLYFYRNRFDVLDHNYQLLFKGKTIDTISHPSLVVSSFGSRRILSTPTVIVNKACCIDGDRLYIMAGSVAKNDPPGIMKDAAVIDVYKLSTGAYLQSLYAYDFRDQKLSAFSVKGDTLTGIFGAWVARFTIQRVRSDR